MIVMGDREFPVRLALPGRHMILNALAAAAVGRHFGLTDEDICLCSLDEPNPDFGRRCIAYVDRNGHEEALAAMKAEGIRLA